ncbi:MAG: hypothetical protein FWF72_00150 [Paludibacter sp.]|nr:hypothetical protein [Paludibacter sp.]
MKYFCIGIILFVSIKVHSQEFITNDSIFYDSLKYKIILPEPQFSLQNTENQLKTNFKSDFDLNYAIKLPKENKNALLPYSIASQTIDFQLYNDTNIFQKNFKTQINQEFAKNRFSFQNFEYQTKNLSGFQKADIFPNYLNVNLFKIKIFLLKVRVINFIQVLKVLILQE